MEQFIQDAASALHWAEQRREPIAPLSETYPDLTPQQAYAIQSALYAIRRQKPVKLVGHKIGLTSAAMQQQLGVDQPDYGFLLDSMVVPAGSALSVSEFIAPRIEPEIAFWLAQDLRGPGITTEDVLAATNGVSASLELVDSRIANWRIRLVDTIADNASSARIIVSTQVVDARGLDLAAEHVTLLRDDESVGEGDGAAVLGHPATAVAWLANKLAEFDIVLREGYVVLPGAMCASVTVSAGHTYKAVFASLGEVSISFEG